ncbi:MAG: hypothetical protein ACTJHU_10860 [Mycetocola sp.]
MLSARQSRLARGLTAATVATYVALSFHVLAGGEPPAIAGTVVPLILASAVCVPLAGARWTPLRLGFAVAVSQLLFHQLFTLGTPSHLVTRGAGGHHGSGDTVSFSAVHSSTTPGPSADSPLMLGMHLLAMATTVLILSWAGHAARQVMTARQRVRRLCELISGAAPALFDCPQPVSSSVSTPLTPQPGRAIAAPRAPPASVLCPV